MKIPKSNAWHTVVTTKWQQHLDRFHTAGALKDDVVKSLRLSASVKPGMVEVAVVPVGLPDHGFGAGRVAASSLAAKGRPLTATSGLHRSVTCPPTCSWSFNSFDQNVLETQKSHRYAMPVVSCLQSVRAAGMTLSQGVTAATTAAVVTAGFPAAEGRLLIGRGGFQGNTVGARGKATDQRESPLLPQPGQNKPKTDRSSGLLRKILFPVAVGVTAVVALPVVVAGLGFGKEGIVAGSLAAILMSIAAITGCGMSVVSCLQSVGAVGMTLAQAATVATTAAVVTAGIQARVVGRLLKFVRLRRGQR